MSKYKTKVVRATKIIAKVAFFIIFILKTMATILKKAPTADILILEQKYFL